uniref:mucin-2-like n=1 Tax=Myxine glutinosa TaxID=7769 RepID=UPI00358F67FA
MPRPSSHQWVQNTSDKTKHGKQQLLTSDVSGQTMNNFSAAAAPSQNYPRLMQHASFLSMSQTSAGQGISQNAPLEQINMALHLDLAPNSSTSSVINKSTAEFSVKEARLSPNQTATPQVHKPVLPHPPSHIPPGMTRVIAATMPCLVVQDSSQNASIQNLGNSVVALPPTQNAMVQATSQPSPMQRLIAAAPCLVVQDQPNATGSPHNSPGHEIVAAVTPVPNKQPAGQTSVIQSAVGYVGRTLTNPSPCCLPAAIRQKGAPPIATTALPRPFPSCRMSVAPVIISRSASATAPPRGTQISVGKPVALGSVIPTPILFQVTKPAPVIRTPVAIGKATAAPPVLGPSPVLMSCSPSLGTAPSTKNAISVLSTPSVTALGRAAVLIGQQPQYLEPQASAGLAIPGGGAAFVLPGHLSEELPPVATPSAL